MPGPSQETVVRVLGAGALGFGLLGAVRPASLAKMMGAEEVTAREIGFRDLGSAIALLATARPRPAIAQRILYDLSDAALFGRGRPKVAAGALAFAALGVLAFFSR